MRVLVRHIIDVEKPINLRRLTAKNKIIVSIKKEWMNTSFYLSSKKKSEQELHRQRVLREDHAKEVILTKLYQELVRSKTLSEKGLKTKEVVISIDAKFGDVLFDKLDNDGNVIHRGILSHNEFSGYKIEQVPENNDIRLAFSDMPYLFRCSRKVIE